MTRRAGSTAWSRVPGGTCGIYLDAGVDAVIFCNEGDRPYSFDAGYDGVGVMTRIVTELRPTDRPFGVDYLWDARAALAIGISTEASFMREVATGVYESDMGLWNTDPAALLRERRRLDSDIAILMNVTPEFASPIGRRGVGASARSAAVSSLADAILISGPMAGSEPDIAALQEAREAVDPDVPVLVNTGSKSTNIGAFLDWRQRWRLHGLGVEMRTSGFGAIALAVPLAAAACSSGTTVDL
jgi:membrane complex biogenesis BtpA family protein